MSKISFSSIEEVWAGTKFDKAYNTQFSNSNDIIDPNNIKNIPKMVNPINNSHYINTDVNPHEYKYDLDKRKKIYVTNKLENEATSLDNDYNFDNIFANDNKQYYKSIDGIKTPNIKSNCSDYNDYYDHIINCAECQAKFRKFFTINHHTLPQNNNNGELTSQHNTIEAFGNMNNTIYTDVICTILIGIFIIFILDFSVNIGKKYIKK
jgi:hypothetical protein